VCVFVTYELGILNYRFDVFYTYGQKLEYENREFKKFIPLTNLIVYELNIHS